MVDAAVSYAIAKLDEFVTRQVNTRRGVPDDIEWLKRELGYLKVSVRAAEAHLELDHIRLWTNEVKDVANQAVIILERFRAQQEEHEAPEQGGVLHCMRSFICNCKKEANLYDIGKDIESLKSRVDQIKNRRDEYHINDMITTTSNVQQRKRTLLRAASFDHEVDVVGFEDDFQTLLAKLCNGDPSLSLISIHGMGGLGKSTLASKLYRSSELNHFQHRAWVCVSEDYDISHVLRKLIICFKSDEQDSLNKMEEVDLLRHLRKILQDRDHYLAVIDDIWDVKVWKQIKNAFPDKKNGSRIIITTRNKVVAEGADDECYVHQLRFLEGYESWQLFCKRAKPTPNLESLGKDMVEKCGGLPLAIVILSGLLLQQKTYSFWSDVKDNLWRKLKGKSSEIQEILNLSYDDLSSHMRECFLYLARYPEDFTLNVLDLKLLWIAEEFVSEADEEDGVDMEDVAEDYLNELINRNMIQIQLLSADGQVLECRVHDLVRDLAIQKAMEHRILGIFDSSKQHPDPIRLLQGQARHVVYNEIGEYLNLIRHNSNDLNLRSLSLITITSRLGSNQMKEICSRFKYLKVLDFTSVVNSKGIPVEIGDLCLLKFLGLMGDIHGGYLAIPASIGKLKKLQTLCGFGEYKFPREICELEELRHLIFDKCSRSLHVSSHQSKLQTLRSISSEEWFKMDTVKFTNLHTLFIYNNQYTNQYSNLPKSSNLESMANLTSLRTLVIDLGKGIISTIQPLSSCKHLKRLNITAQIKDPAELNFLPDSITELTLCCTSFEQDPMPTLGRLPNLIALSLILLVAHPVDEDTFDVPTMVCSEDAFPCLQILKIRDENARLKELQVDDRALPCLKAFQISRRSAATIPQRIASLPTPKVPTLLEYRVYSKKVLLSL